jgi:CheY-like chemotaxis protein/predicted regulator of Ras-like GTPase activity (Roadblock/LC7/MglB family)
MPKVLIVDDSLSVRKVVERILESRQLTVLQASLGTEAIERIQKDEPDLVVCDVLLPDREGYDVCEFVKSHPRLDRTPVLLISGIVNPAVEERAERVGAAGVMRKPFSAEELTGRVNDLLGRVAAARTSPARVNGTAGPSLTGPTPSPSATAPPNGITATTPAPSVASSPATSVEGCLAALAAAEGVHAVVLADRGGRLIGAAGSSTDAAMLGAETACLVSASDELGAGLRRGDVQGLILEHGRGLVLVNVLGESAVLTLVLDEPAALGKARYYVKKVVPDLLEVL